MFYKQVTRLPTKLLNPSITSGNYIFHYNINHHNTIQHNTNQYNTHYNTNHHNTNHHINSTLNSTKTQTRFFSTLAPRVAIVGSGPAGFYTAQHLIKNIPDLKVDLFESLPLPFGLVRYGVAPDHQDVKNVTNTFTQTAEKPRVSWYGNVGLGRDIALRDLRRSYNAVVLAYGASEDKLLGIPGENLKNVLSASSFINWYNGYPGFQNLDVNLDCETCVLVGQGNVAVDVARMLLSPLSLLQQSDMSSYAVERLRKSKVRRVCLVGRRGPLQVAFTTAEFRELTKLPASHTLLHPKDFEEVKLRLNEIQRPRKRLVELQMKQLEVSPSKSDVSKELEIIFKRSPLSFLPHPSDSSSVGGVELAVNRLQGDFGHAQKAESTNEREILETNLVIKSIGYRSVQVDEDIPFDIPRGLVPNRNGRVVDHKGLYCSGWLKTGPTGVLASTMNSAFETAAGVVEDFKSGFLNHHDTIHLAATLNKIKNKCVTFSDWKKIDEYEKLEGEKQGKVREKVVDLQKILRIAGQNV